MKLQDAISEARKLAEEKTAHDENADKCVEIAEPDHFKIYVAAGKTVGDLPGEACMRIQETFSCWCLKEKWSLRLKKGKNDSESWGMLRFTQTVETSVHFHEVDNRH